MNLKNNTEENLHTSLSFVFFVLCGIFLVLRISTFPSSFSSSLTYSFLPPSLPVFFSLLFSFPSLPFLLNSPERNFYKLFKK